MFFVLAAMTYVEGASLHQERAGSTVFARYAFNELVELRRRLGDPARLRDPDRGHGVLGDELPRRVLGAARAAGALELVVALAIIAYVAVRNVLGFSGRASNRIAALVVADLVAAAR